MPSRASLQGCERCDCTHDLLRRHSLSVSYALAIYPDKISFVLDKIKSVVDKKFLSETKHFFDAKNFISAMHYSLKMTSFVQKLTVSSGRAIFLDLYVAEMNFLAMDKISETKQSFLAFIKVKLAVGNSWAGHF